jgi:glycosyltransferase involved in cell wall biosynthesis
VTAQSPHSTRLSTSAHRVGDGVRLPLVSIVIPAFNRASTIGAALQSVQAQTCRDWEAIVVDDGSVDGTSDAVRRLAKEDPRIELRQHARNLGAQAARNTGIRGARAPWIAFLDSDDRWLPRSLDLRLAAAFQSRVNVVHSPCYRIGEDGNQVLYQVDPTEGWVYPDLLRAPGPMFQGLLVSKRALGSIGGLDERIVAMQEWDTAIRLAEHHAFRFVAQPTFIWDCRGVDTITNNRRREAVGYEQVVRKHFFSMLRHAGARATARHYEIIGVRYESAGSRSAAFRSFGISAILSPLPARRAARLFRRFLARGHRAS